MKSHVKLSIAYLGKQAGIGLERSKSAFVQTRSLPEYLDSQNPAHDLSSGPLGGAELGE